MKKTIHIKWMHCVSCDLILEKELKKNKWADLIMVNHKKWIMEVDFKKESAYKDVVKSIEKNWFKVVNEWEKKNGNDIFSNLIVW